MSSAIVKTLSKELSISEEHAQRVFEFLGSGYRAPFIAHFRRTETGCMNDGVIRRFARRSRQLEDLDKRRATLLRQVEEQRKAHPAGDAEAEAGPSLDRLQSSMDRFALEDAFLPHRRPEPEVQLAMDRGLAPLADLLVAPTPGRKGRNKPDEAASTDATATAVDDASSTPEEVSVESAAATEEARDQVDVATAPAESSSDDDASATSETAADGGVPAAAQTEPESETEEHAGEGVAAPQATPEATPQATPDTSASAEVQPTPAVSAPKESASEPPSRKEPAAEPPQTKIELTAKLARACADFVKTDRGVHTDEQALEGAMRILSDRLGRSPELRGALRKIMRKSGRLSVRALVDEKKLGRNRSLLKLNAPIRQIQGHRLLALRQAQAQRQIATTITIDESHVLPRVRAALGKSIDPDFKSVADVVAQQALRQRLAPMIEEDVRNELREHADEEAIRFIAQHLRHILFAPAAGPRPAAGVNIDARGDWQIVIVDRNGQPQGEEIKVEAGGKEAAHIAESLGAALRSSGIRALVVANSKGIRAEVQKLREVIHLLKAEGCVFLANEAGLSHYANSELARKELPDYSVPARQAISLARRYQDPLAELIKADLRHLGLGREQSAVSKANLRRVLNETVESCVAAVGCDLNTAPLSLLRHIPGLNFEIATKLIERRNERPFSSREELRTEGLLDDLTWTNAIAFLRVADSSEPLDRTALHPEQYDLVRRIILDNGGSVDETLGQRDATKGMRRSAYEVEEPTWREITREIAHPGRDPRLRLFTPQLLPPDTDTKTLEKDQVVEGIVSNVASFGAFVDLGVPRDGMIHISEIAGRYVRDARGFLAIGQLVRARVLDASGQRVELSLKNVPEYRRSGGGIRPQNRRRGGKDDRESKWPEYQPVMRAARSRRDGLVTGSPGGGGRGGGGGGRGGGGGGGGRGGGGAGGGKGRGSAGGRRPGRRGQDDGYDVDAVRKAKKDSGAYNPFANFFKDKQGEGGETSGGSKPEDASVKAAPRNEVPAETPPTREVPQEGAPGPASQEPVSATSTESSGEPVADEAKAGDSSSES